MRKHIILVIIFIIIVISSGCNNANNIKETFEPTHTVQNTQKPVPTHDELSDRVEQAKYILYGEWELKYYYPMAGFTVYSIDEADSLIGVRIKISKDSIYFDNRKLSEEPEFSGKIITEESILDDGAGERSFEYYGIEYGDVLRIYLTLDSCIIQEMDKSLYIYIKTQNCLLINIGGTYYEAIKVE